ncbi:nucleoside monophosphate kinase [Patescibacteria group bacterium]|nr:nucleoside monophosphate kinase [Patescibacteria group bacterium]
MKIILLGKQGSGKGTQGKLIEKKYKIPHTNTGDIFREISKEKTKLGNKVRGLIDKGNLVPDEITIKIVLDKFKSKRDFILDGFPRNIKQARALEQIGIDIAILLDISDEAAIRRLTSRRTCSKCEAIYNIITARPKKQGICDKCKNKLTQRKDDTEKAIRKRLKIYKKDTKPLIDFYKHKGILKTVNGELPTEKTFDDICVILDRM